MPKRVLSVQNQGNERQQQQQEAPPKPSYSITTRSSSKRASTTTETAPAKKAKTDKENVPEHVNPSSKEPELEPTVPLPSQDIPEPILHTLSDNSDDDDDDDQEEYPIPIISNNNKLPEHSTNKQYLIYESSNSSNEPYIISKTARYWSEKYRKTLAHVNPDAYGMYIHNDFWCYGELEVVENCLLDLTKTIFIVQQGVFNRLNFMRKPDDKVNYVLGFRRLEVLTILLNDADGISGIDDGERFGYIMRVIGACYVTILRGLLPKIMFEKMTNSNDENLIKKLKKILKQIPNFKQVLEQSIIIGHICVTIGDVCSAYTQILQIIYCNWMLMMENITIDLNEPTNTLNKELWKALKHADSINPNDIENGKESFDFLKELRLYKGQYGLGGDSYDLSKWSRTERDAYKLGRRNPFQGFWYF